MTCSGDQKETTMVLKVDLDCCQCYRKIKKTLCKFPQIRNQVYDEKNNTVTITVICCSPERIMDKLCCKAGKSIKSIEIKPPNKPHKPKPAPEAKPPAPAPSPAPASKPADAPPKPPKQANPTPAPAPAPAPSSKPVQPAPNRPEQVAPWGPGYPPGPPPQVYPVAPVCCSSCYEGRPGGPCYQGGYGPCPGYGYQYGRPACPPGYYGSRCDYFCEDNPSACSIM